VKEHGWRGNEGVGGGALSSRRSGACKIGMAAGVARHRRLFSGRGGRAASSWLLEMAGGAALAAATIPRQTLRDRKKRLHHRLEHPQSAFHIRRRRLKRNDIWLA